MKRTNTLSRIGILCLLMLGILFILPEHSHAQDKKERVVVKKRSGADKSSGDAIEVEIKDGKIIVDGEVVAEVETDGRKVRVLHNGDGNSSDATIWIDADGDFKGEGNYFTFKGKDGAKTFSVFDKDDKAFFSDDGSGTFVFKSDDGSKVIERMLDMNALKGNMAEARIHSQMAPMKNRLLQLNENGNGFEVYSGALASFGNGETMKLDMKSRELAMNIRSSDGDTSKLEAELDDLLAEIFSLKQESYQSRVDRLRKELSDLEQMVGDRKANQNDIIAKRKKELLGTTDKFDW